MAEQKNGAPPTQQQMRSDDEFVKPTFSETETCLICLSKCTLVCCCPLYWCCSLATVQDYERGVILRVGKRMHEGTLQGGMHVLLPCGVDNLLKIDIREQFLDVRKQEVVIKDGLSLVIDAVLYYKIFNANRALLSIQNVKMSIHNLAQTKLREELATRTFDEIQSERAAMAENLKKVLDEATDPWGVDITRVEITDIKLPTEMQRAMGSEAEAKRNARAKLIEADGEKRAAVTLREAADIMSEAPDTMKLRFLQTLTQISAEKNSTIVIPFPADILSSLAAIQSDGKKRSIYKSAVTDSTQVLAEASAPQAASTADSGTEDLAADDFASAS